MGPRPGSKATVDHPNSVGAHDDYANALALTAAVASKKPGRRMFEGWGDRMKRDEEEPSTPPASEPYVVGVGVVRPGSAPFYWTHECGTQRLVDPSSEKQPYRCLRRQAIAEETAASVKDRLASLAQADHLAAAGTVIEGRSICLCTSSRRGALWREAPSQVSSPENL